MTLYELWKRAEREVPAHLKISEKYFGNQIGPISESDKDGYIREFSATCPNLFRYIQFSMKYPLSPKQFQAYLKEKTQKDWSLILNILKSAPESEILRAKEYCKEKKFSAQDFEIFEKNLRETPTLHMSFECALDKQTKLSLSLESILLRPEVPVNCFDTDQKFNMYLWVMGGPVKDGTNFWANCAKNENSEILKNAVFEQMKHINLIIKNEEKEK